MILDSAWRVVVSVGLFWGAPPDDAALEAALAKPVVAAKLVEEDVRNFVRPRVARLPAARSPEDWVAVADRLRERVRDEVVFRGAAAREWRGAACKVELLDELPGGEGYRLRKLRYEAVPGLWIPAVLYEPFPRPDDMPAFLNVNGHDRRGTAAPYKQARCVNLAKRGILTLNVEWVGMGQLGTAGFGHGRMNQIDLCGASGLAIHVLAMERAIDFLIEQPGVRRARIGLAGLSGGGWQTIVGASLDTRVTFANPVAGYSSFLTRLDHYGDLGDSEQTPVDLGAVADYATLTALLAPRAALLTFNARDNCCFASGHALPPLQEAADPIYKLLGRADALTTHVNHHPGDHNFERDNREALYRALGSHWFADRKDYSAVEIPCEAELKTREELNVPLPEGNLDFHALAQGLAARLPRATFVPTDAEGAARWKEDYAERLRDVVRYPARTGFAIAEPIADEASRAEVAGDWTVERMVLRGAEWRVPATVIAPAAPQRTRVVVADAGRKGVAAYIRERCLAGERVVCVDPFLIGDAHTGPLAYLWGLMVSTVAERPLGVQAHQIALATLWGAETYRQPTVLTTIGPRASVAGLCAAALEPRIAELELIEPAATLKRPILDDLNFADSPDAFCFGLIEHFEVDRLAKLVAPRPLTVRRTSDASRPTYLGLAEWWTLCGAVGPTVE
jgi:hypothetical protein